MADISIRESIQWKPDPPSEPTSTLVLTSPGRNFVDVRILLPIDPSGILTPSQLDWAFAGTSSTSEVLPQAGGGGGRHTATKKVRSAVWRHWVDSRSPEAESVVDQAEVRVEPDGRAVEVGRMVNPATGAETEYEEVWREGEEVGGGGVVVLRTEERGRGMVVRVGGWVQGVLREGEGVSVGRWERTEGGWRVVARMGGGMDEVLGVVTGEKKGDEWLRVGGKVPGGGRVWEVVELVGDVDGVMS